MTVLRPALFVVILAAAPFGARAATPETTRFVHDASVAGLFEIEASQLALQKSDTPAVRAFAQAEIDTATQNQMDLQTTAAMAGAPTPDVALDDSRQADITRLNDASGEDFDRLYVALQSGTHLDAAQAYRDYAKGGDVTALRDFAGDNLAQVESHLDQVRSLNLADAPQYADSQETQDAGQGHHDDGLSPSLAANDAAPGGGDDARREFRLPADRRQ